MKLKDIIINNPFTVAALLFATVVSGFTFMYSPSMAFAELVLIIVISIFAIKWMSDSLSRKRQDVKLLSDSLIESGELSKEMAAFPLPVVLIDKDHRIIWFNDLFSELANEYSDFLGLNISEILILPNDLSVPFETENHLSGYTVYPSQLDDERIALYFVDDTVLKNIRAEFNASRPVVLLINVDSLEQAEDILAHEDFYTLNSDIDRFITKWLVEYNCVFRKFGDGRFIAITECVNLDAMIKTRFNILDKARAYHYVSDEIDVTLSIGVGKEKNFRESEISARMALDMARGRGGDQAAVRKNEDYEFFGGILSGKEKRGKVKSRTIATAFDELIDTCSDVLVMGHSFGDFDSVGSSVGIATIVKAKGKQVHIVVNKKNSMSLPLINMLKNDPMYPLIISPEDAYERANENTLLVITDTMRAEIVDAPRLLEKKLRLFIVDHHRKPVNHLSSTPDFLEPHASSACEMVTELIQYSPSKPKLTSLQAQALLAGIMLDTKDFSLRVGVRTFEAAAYLRELKADTVSVRKLFAGSFSENVEVNRVIGSADFFNGIAFAVDNAPSKDSRLICSKAADKMLDIDGVDASFVMWESGGTVYISARSLGRVNVQLIMEKLGGGGHLSMAAAQLKDTTSQDAFLRLKEAIDDYYASKK